MSAPTGSTSAATVTTSSATQTDSSRGTFSAWINPQFSSSSISSMKSQKGKEVPLAKADDSFTIDGPMRHLLSTD